MRFLAGGCVCRLRAVPPPRLPLSAPAAPPPQRRLVTITVAAHAEPLGRAVDRALLRRRLERVMHALGVGSWSLGVALTGDAELHKLNRLAVGCVLTLLLLHISSYLFISLFISVPSQKVSQERQAHGYSLVPHRRSQGELSCAQIQV